MYTELQGLEESMNELVSILIPVYNREGIIAATLDSALAQSYLNTEIIVVDNASTDRTWIIIQEYAEKNSRIKIFRNESNLGPVRNWLRCIDNATGYYAKILWSDDLIAPDFLEKTLPLFESDVGFVYSGVKIFTDVPENGNSCYFIGKTDHYDSEEYISRALFDKNVPVSPGCAIFRLSDLKKNLLLNVPNKIGSDFSMHAIGGDLLIFLLISLNYRRFGFVSEPLSFFRAHEGSISIASKDGKLPLHYLLAKSHFVDSHSQQYREKLAAFANFLLMKYPSHRNYGIESIDSLFQTTVKIDRIFLMRLILTDMLLRPIRLTKKLLGR